MHNIEYLKLLADRYPNVNSAAAEMINLRSICGMPKGTEYFFSDLHGEHQAFIHQLKSASGVIKTKIDELFSRTMPERDRVALAGLIYEPEEVLKKIDHESPEFEEWFKISVSCLIDVCREFAGKCTVSRVRKKAPAHFAYIIDEFLHFVGSNRDAHFERMIKSVLNAAVSDDFLIGLCKMIRDISIDRLHIIGDIFDRGPRADLIMDELMQFHDIDIQWGNHDIVWMGAAVGNLTCIANVLRVGISYNNFDVLEDGYGINLRPLSMFAAEMYKNDDCVLFRPHILDESEYDCVSSSLTAKMHKAIAVIQYKLEGQLYRRNPEYSMLDRDILSNIDYKNFTIKIDGIDYKLNDKNFPTIDINSPLELTSEEATLMSTLRASFKHSETLQRHIKFLYEKGSIYLICNGNLLYHGCIPMTKEGEFEEVTFGGKKYSGRRYLDYINEKVRNAFFAKNDEKTFKSDIFWYLWCGKKSPVFGKSKLSAFEHCFIDDKTSVKEILNPYYSNVESREVCEKILAEFGLGENCHIINGHVPVKNGENPIKGDGLLFMIDGGISKAYQPKTGIGGYTFIFSSRYMAFAKHSPDEWKNNKEIPTICEVKWLNERLLVEKTDRGAELIEKINELNDLLLAYRSGKIKEHN